MPLRGVGDFKGIDHPLRHGSIERQQVVQGPGSVFSVKQVRMVAQQCEQSIPVICCNFAPHSNLISRSVKEIPYNMSMRSKRNDRRPLCVQQAIHLELK